MDREREMGIGDLRREVQWQYFRASGKGGQHVNKVETGVALRWHLPSSSFFDEEEKQRLREALRARLSRTEWLILRAQTARTQGENRALALERFERLITQALKVPKKRKSTRLPAWAKEKRKAAKQKHAEKKARRRTGPFLDLS